MAQRDKKINLNFPLPVSNDPHEAVRQKWINDSYQLLKRVLPPRAVDTPEELAELGQFVVNIIDYRDPDCTITIWTNPDVLFVVLQNSVSTPPAPTSATAAPPVLYFSNAKTIPATNTTYPFVTYGMEYNPVALNEVLAYSFLEHAARARLQNNRFFVELVNTLTQTAAVNQYSILSGSRNARPRCQHPGPGRAQQARSPPAADPYAGACWDLVFTGDDPASRPDPYRGDLFGSGAPPPATPPTVAPNLYGLIPLNKNSFSQSAVDAKPGSPRLRPVYLRVGSSTATTPPTNFFYVIGNPQANAGSESNPPSPTATPPTLVQTLTTGFDPLAEHHRRRSPGIPASCLERPRRTRIQRQRTTAARSTVLPAHKRLSITGCACDGPPTCSPRSQRPTRWWSSIRCDSPTSMEQCKRYPRFRCPNTAVTTPSRLVPPVLPVLTTRSTRPNACNPIAAVTPSRSYRPQPAFPSDPG